MTLPTIAGIQSRITTIANRPPIMLADAVAEVFGTNPSNLMRQVRRNMDLFPDGFLIELSDEDLREQLRQIGTTAERKRTDLTHFGFTEAGALMVPHVLRTPEARAAAPVVVRAFLARRDEEQSALRRAAFKLESAYIGRSAMKQAIKQAAAQGLGFWELWGWHDWSAFKLAQTIEEMRALGFIPAHALFVPEFVFTTSRRKAEMELMARHAEDDRQMRLGLEV